MSLCAFSFRFVSSFWLVNIFVWWHCQSGYDDKGLFQYFFVITGLFCVDLFALSLSLQKRRRRWKAMRGRDREKRKDRKSMTLNCYGRFCYKTRNWFNSQFFIYYLRHPNVHSVLFVCLFWFVCSFSCTCCLPNTYVQRETEKVWKRVAVTRWDLCWMRIWWHRNFFPLPYLFGDNVFLSSPYFSIVFFESPNYTYKV